MSTEDRRAPGATRIPFDGLVELGGALGPAFEAQAVNICEDGMLLRTAYLPEQGQPLTCRFDAGPGESVLASGEVVWAMGEEKGGEFAIRFTDMDPASVAALRRACGIGVDVPQGAPPGSKVRLHIEGLASPMRAKIKDSYAAEITVGSDLGFLQVGKQLELEDAESGAKRPAAIDRVEVAVDPVSHVPQLVVTLRYADVETEPGARAVGRPARASEFIEAPSPAAAPPTRRQPAAGSAREADDLAAVEEASIKMKGTVARGIANIGPAFERLASRVKTTVALLAARRAARGDDPSAPRRTTAPAPGGGLHATGRRVIRGDGAGSSDEATPEPKLRVTKRKAAIASAVMLTAILGAIALKKAHHEGPPGAEAAAPQGAHASTTSSEIAPSSSLPPTALAPATPPAAVPPMDPAPSFGGGLSQSGALAVQGDEGDSPSHGGHKRSGRVTPFGNGPVHHGNVLRLKMDGPIESIEGAQQPTGFTVKIPGHKSLEAAGPLAARDSRIAAIKVSNDPAGAELTVSFRDGVPNYRVSGRGDTLVIALAPAGALDKTVAKNDAKGSKAGKHGKTDHKNVDRH